MEQERQPTLDVFSPREIARAAGVPVRDVARLVRSGAIATIDGEFVGTGDAVRAVRRLRAGREVISAARPGLFSRPASARRPTGLPLAASSAVHASGFVLLVLLSTWGASRPEARPETTARVMPARLVYLNLPGPGGGGGGGGLRQPTPPPVAMRKGPSPVTSPVTIRRPRPASQSFGPPRPPRRAEPAPKPVESVPPAIPANPLPPVVAPVVSLAADPMDRIGLLDDSTAREPSAGPGEGGGGGTGAGSGIGEGMGPGIGPGSGGGTGGGPYRPGSGIEPPRLVREVKPRYTEAARRQAVEGEVVVEVVVRRDGRVGDVRVMQRLGAGLDEQAVEAVRQWQFEPARRLGTPVDVLVEVAVEFRLR